MKIGRNVLIPCVAGALLWPSIARATLVAEETFSYSIGADLAGQNGGTGWAGPWSTAASGATGAFTIASLAGEPPGVSEMGAALSIKNGLSSVTRIFRPIDLSAGSAAANAGLVETVPTIFGTNQAELGKPGTTVWLGFIARGHTSSVSAGSHLFEGTGSGTDACGTVFSHGFTESDKLGENIFIGRGNGNANYGYERTCGHGIACNAHSVNKCNGNDYQSSIAYSTGVVHWVVVRFDFGSNLGASDATAVTTTMWVDPTPAASDPDATTGTSLFEVGVAHTPNSRTQWVESTFHFNTVELQSVTAGSEFDEYRIGTTFADVSGSGGCDAGQCQPPPDAGVDAGSAGGSGAGGAAGASGGAGGSGLGGAGGTTTGGGAGGTTTGGAGTGAGGSNAGAGGEGPSGTGGAAGANATSGATGGASAGSSGGATSTTTATGGGESTSGSSTSSGGNGAAPSSDTGGCSCKLVEGRRSPGWWMASWLGALLLARRRRPRSSPRI